MSTPNNETTVRIDPATGASVTVIEDVVFAEPDGHPLLADVYLPAEAPEPPAVIVYLHGGGWRAGTRKADADLQLVPLAGRGLAVVSVDYRLTDVASFPSQIHDAKAAIRWVRAHADAYGWDPSRVGALGGSAGGHLAGLLALTAGDEELEGTVGVDLGHDSSIGAAALLFPVVDPAQWDRESFSREQPPPDTFAGRYPSWPPPPRAALLLGVEDAEAAPELNAAASVLTYVGAENAPPFLLLHGDADSAVSLDHSLLLHRELEQAGIGSSLLIVAGADHVDARFGRPEIIGAISSFFDSALGPAAQARR